MVNGVQTPAVQSGAIKKPLSNLPRESGTSGTQDHINPNPSLPLADIHYHSHRAVAVRGDRKLHVG